jgi:hypothetical protein
MYKLLKNSQATFELVAKDAYGMIISDFNVTKDQMLLTTTEGVVLTIESVTWTNGIGLMIVDIPALSVLQTSLTLKVQNQTPPFDPNPFVVQIIHAYGGRFILNESVAAWDMIIPATSVTTLTDYSDNNRIATKSDGISSIQPSLIWLATDAYITEAGGYQYTVGSNMRSWANGSGDSWIGLIDANGRTALCEPTDANTYPVKTLQLIVAGWNLGATFRELIAGYGMKIAAANIQDGLGLVVSNSSLDLISANGTVLLTVPSAGLFGSDRQIVSLTFTYNGSIVEFYVNQNKIGQANWTRGNLGTLTATLFASSASNPSGWPVQTDSGASKFAIFDFAAYSTVKSVDFIAGNAAAWGL